MTPLPPDEMSIGTSGAKKVIRFGNTIRNLGKGPWEIKASVASDGTTKAYQQIYKMIRDSQGKFLRFEFSREVLVGTFVFAGHQNHNHFHFDKFAEYTLLSENFGPVAGAGTPTNKVSFCMMDFDPIDKTMEGAAQSGVYSCDPVKQGISVGWADTYGAGLDGQEIDITNVPNGTYWVVTKCTTAPIETTNDKTNNNAATKVKINGTSVTTLEKIDGVTLKARMSGTTPPPPPPPPVPTPTPPPPPVPTPPPLIPPPTTNPNSGLTQRVRNDTAIIRDIDAPSGPLLYTSERVFPANTFRALTQITNAGDGTKRLFAVERHGRVWAMDQVADPLTSSPQKKLFLDISTKVKTNGMNEEGLLSIAFHPQFKTSGYVFVCYTTGANYTPSTTNTVRTRVSRMKASGTSAPWTSIDPASELVLLEVTKGYGNHNGGQLAFGPDGKLYISIGDGGGGGDPERTGQNLNSLKGKILRIDPSNGTTAQPYTIPSDNPFANQTGKRGEIWAYGLRNVWRFSFDRGSGRLWAGDVGQDVIEEVDIVEKGQNYGWSGFEGTRVYNSGVPVANHAKPVIEYGRNVGSVVIGGYVYRGTRLPWLQGAYIYGDYSSGNFWAARHDGTALTENTKIFNAQIALSTFGEDEDAELYFGSYSESAGAIYRIKQTSGGGGNFPKTLSATNLFSNLSTQKMRPELMPYDVNAPLWSDAALKARYFAVPGYDRVDHTMLDNAGFDMPNLSVLVKHFWLERTRGDAATKKIVETRLLIKNGAGWYGYSYEWNDAGTDGNLLYDAKDKPYPVKVGSNETTVRWHYPSRTECFRCHTEAAGRVLGPNVPQLNRDFDYTPFGGRPQKNQLVTLDAIGSLLKPLAPATPATLPKLVDPKDATKPLEARVRAYLSANCSHCHRPRGGAPVQMDLRFDTPLDAMKIVNALPETSDLGITGARLVKPKDPAGSLLLQRMKRRDSNQMPPVGTSVVDDEAVKLITDWINSLP